MFLRPYYFYIFVLPHKTYVNPNAINLGLPLLLAKFRSVTANSGSQYTLCLMLLCVCVGVWFLYEVQDVTTTPHTHRAEDNKRPQRAPACSSVFWRLERSGWECLLFYTTCRITTGCRVNRLTLQTLLFLF